MFEEEAFGSMNTVTGEDGKRKKKMKNKRRFSDEQIRSLESMFENETRLEPRKKVELAKELGLQPRQVAIWFQNKRARYKSKQLERDFRILSSNYNTLASRFETLKKEKQALAAQLQRLNDLTQRPKEGQCRDQIGGSNSSEGESENGETPIYELPEVKPSLLSLERSEHGLEIFRDEDSSIKAEYFGVEEEEEEQAKLMRIADGSFTTTTTTTKSQEDWGSLDSDGLFDQSSSSYQWWDFWA